MNKFNPKENILYLDMDGVVADFDKFVLDAMGKNFANDSFTDDKQMWDYLDSIDHFYFKLDPTPYAHRLFALANTVADNVQFLTALPSKGQAPTAREDKVNWVKKHFGPDVKVNFGPYSKDKWKHANPGDILIDDRADNIESWIKRGHGNGILHYYNNYDRTAELLHNIVNN